VSAVPTPDPKDPKPSSRPGGAKSLLGAVVGGRYRLVRVIGEGGTSAVYEAEHVHMHKRLAVKVLSPEMSRSPEAVARFEREAVAASRIEHPNVAAATDFGALEDGSFFLVLDLVEGRTLREVLGAAGERFDPARALRIARQAASGLAAAHALGIVHRDLKPENLVLAPRDGDPDFLKILDFGIAKVPVSDIAPDAPQREALTKLGMVYGTPEYMSPEQAMGATVDVRADLYSLGVILFELLAGVRPFDEDNKVVLLGMHVTAPIPTLAEKTPGATVPPEVEHLARKLMAKSPGDRFQTADEVVAAIDAQLARLAARADPNPPAPQLATLPLGALRAPAPPRRSEVGRVVEHVLVQLEGALPLDRLRLPMARRQKLWAAIGLVALLALVAATVAVVAIVRLNGRSTGAAKSASAAPPGDARARCLAASAAGDRGSVVREASAWASASPSAAEQDDEVARAVGAAALDSAAADRAFELLETKLGRAGADVIYDLAYGSTATSAPATATRAKHALEDDAVKPHMSAALAVTVAIRSSSDPCEAKKKYFAQAAKDGDARTLDALTPYLKRGGCGRKGRKDCHPCLRFGSDSVEKTVEAIRARVKPPAAP
jgi:tRNA A-37 threonylcarbamoyl transferase component Bud32